MAWKGDASEALRKQKLLKKDRWENKEPKARGRRMARTTVVKRKNNLFPSINAYLIAFLICRCSAFERDAQ